MFENQSTAQNVLLGSGIQFFTGAVSSYDGIDYYKLQVNNQSSLNLSLYGLSADVNAYLFDNAAKLVASSTKTGTSSESINTTLDAGTYFVKVDSSLLKNSQGYTNSSYQLSISNNSLFSNIDDKNSDGQMFYTGDFNGDGIQDVFRQERGSWVNGAKDAEFLIGKANGSFDAPVQVANSSLFQGNNNRLIFGDFNGDRKTDIIRQQYNGWSGANGAQFYSLSNGNFQLVANVADSDMMKGDSTNLIAGDFNGDGFDDLIRQEKGSLVDDNRDVELYTSNGTFGWNSRTLLTNSFTVDGNEALLVAGDFIAGGGKDLMRIEIENTIINSVNDIQYLSYQNSNMEVVSNTPKNIAPQAPLVYGVKASYDANSTLTLGTSYAWDSNGWQDISKVDFWLTNALNQRIELTDANSFISYNQNYAKFSYSTSLNGIAAGDYKLNAVAYDKSGAASNRFSQALMIKPPANIAPQAPLIYGVKASYDANSTLTLGTSYAWDSNGWQDVSKVDFWLTNAQGGRVELADANSFISYSQNYAKFGYSTSLNGIAAGDYKLNAVAYDKAGAASNTFTQALAIKALNIAPNTPVITGIQSSYDANSTLTIDSGSIADSNGWQDVSKVQFWLTDAQGNKINTSDVTSFTANDVNSAKFSYSTSLNGLAAGDYKLNAVAYDKAGLASNQFSQALAIKAANIAPNTPVITGIKSSYDANSTLTIDSGSIADSNGWQDVSKVDFWLTNAQGQRIELADVSDFATKDANSARFSYTVSLSGIAIGNYKLNAVAYDKAGLASNPFTQDISIKAANIAPWKILIYDLQSIYDVNSTISLNQGYAWDSDGWQDINKVDFWLTNAQGQRLELADADTFIYNDLNWAQFKQNISLNGFAAGDYTLNAIAYDKAGVAGTQFAQSFVISSAAKPDIDIQLVDTYSAFTSDQKRAFAVAESNWERIITNDKDRNGIIKIAVTQSYNNELSQGESFQGSNTIANAYLDLSIGYRYNFSGDRVDLGGVDYYSRINWNSYMLGSFSFADLVGVMMHEIGHTLGLTHEENSTLMGAYLGDRQLLSSEGFDKLERLGYKVDRTARIDWA
jgi:Bacterial pre-peptidase C-terminal domain/FG-GAP-like repeat